MAGLLATAQVGNKCQDILLDKGRSREMICKKLARMASETRSREVNNVIGRAAGCRRLRVTYCNVMQYNKYSKVRDYSKYNI